MHESNRHRETILRSGSLASHPVDEKEEGAATDLGEAVTLYGERHKKVPMDLLILFLLLVGDLN